MLHFVVPPPDVMLHFVVPPLGRYAFLFSFRLRTLCFILFFPPPDVMLYDMVVASDVMLYSVLSYGSLS